MIEVIQSVILSLMVGMMMYTLITCNQILQRVTQFEPIVINFGRDEDDKE